MPMAVVQICRAVSECRFYGAENYVLAMTVDGA